MADERSGSGLGKACAITCGGCGLLVLIVGAILATIAPNAVGRVKGMMDRETMMEDWRGPEFDAPADALLPSEVDGLSRGSIINGPGPEVLDLEEEVWPHATYSDDKRTVEVWVKQADAAERDDRFEWAKAAIRERDVGITRSWLIGDAQNFRFGDPTQAAGLWWADEWLFMFVAERAEDLGDFGDELFAITDQVRPVELESPL